MQPRPIPKHYPSSSEDSGLSSHQRFREEIVELDSSDVQPADTEWQRASPPTERDIPKNNKRSTMMIVASVLTFAFLAFLAWYMLQPTPDFGAIPVEGVNEPQPQPRDVPTTRAD